MTVDYTNPNNTPQSPAAPTRQAHEIEYEIHGADMQYVEIYLDLDEIAIGENGTMMFMESGIQMDTKMGDGSEKNSGVFGTLAGMAKRKMTGENIFLSFFTNKVDAKRRVAFSAPHPGMIVPIDLREMGGNILCQKGAFLCASKGVAIDIGLTKRLGAGFFGGEGFILQKLTGDGMVFIHVGGAIMQRDLKPGEAIHVDIGSLVGFQPSVKFDIQMVTGVKNIMFGQESLFLTTLVGPGRVWLQSMPYGRIVDHMIHQFILATDRKNKG